MDLKINTTKPESAGSHQEGAQVGQEVVTVNKTCSCGGGSFPGSCFCCVFEWCCLMGISISL